MPCKIGNIDAYLLPCEHARRVFGKLQLPYLSGSSETMHLTCSTIVRLRAVACSVDTATGLKHKWHVLCLLICCSLVCLQHFDSILVDSSTGHCTAPDSLLTQHIAGLNGKQIAEVVDTKHTDHQVRLLRCS